MMPRSSLNIVFMGTPDFAAVALARLLAGPHRVVAVYTRAPKPKGRGQQMQKTPVHELAEKQGIPVYTPTSLRKSEEDQAIFEKLDADVAVVAAYGLILPPRVLAAPRFGCLNIHGSLLPRWRGAAPIQRAILAGDDQTGITIMQMDEGMDTGGMIAARAVPIGPAATTPQMFEVLADLGAKMMVQVLDDIAARGMRPDAAAQDEKFATHAAMISRTDAQVDFGAGAAHLDRQVRALNPWPGVQIKTPKGEVIKILSGQVISMPAECQGGGALINREGDISCGGAQAYRVMLLQSPSGKKMDMAAFINGGGIKVGERFNPC